jgi:hypothetical protein
VRTGEIMRIPFTSSFRLIYCCVFLFIPQPLSAAPNSPATVSITISGNLIEATGITAGQDAIVFGCAIGKYSGLPEIVRQAVVVHDSDGDGAISLVLPNVPVTSVWAVVDYSSGRYAIGTPSGFTAKVAEISDHDWKKDTSQIDVTREWVEVLLVRPGGGAWTLRAGEGSANDADGASNRNLRAALSRMQFLHGDPSQAAPEKAKSKDLLIIIDPHELDVLVKEAQ